MELVAQTVDILKQGGELMQNPAVSGAVTGFFSWVKGVFTKKSAKEKLELIEKNQHNEEVMAGLQANLEYVLEDNEELQKQLAEKIKEFQSVLQQAGVDNRVDNSQTTSNANVTNSTNTKFLQGIKIDGNITIN